MTAHTSFYIVPHADDWQLFMQPYVFNHLIDPDHRDVFIITTAGDAGMGEKFWRAREEGLKSSVRFCLAPLTTISEQSGTSQVNNHNISYWLLNNSICYFLRLPDGNLDGRGFESNNFQSLTRLLDGQISSITAVDNSTIYYDWEDLCTTIDHLLSLQAGASPDTWVNYLNPDSKENPGDHCDHLATGQAIQAGTNSKNLRQRLFSGYSVATRKQKLSATELFWKAGMFAAYEKAVFDLCGYSTIKEGIDTYLNWCSSGPAYQEVLP